MIGRNTKCERRLAGKVIGIAIAALTLVGGLGVGPAAAADYYRDPYAHNFGWTACNQWVGETTSAMANDKFYSAWWRTTLWQSFDNGRTWVMRDNTQPWIYMPKGGGAGMQTQQYPDLGSGLYAFTNQFVWQNGTTITEFTYCRTLF